MIHWGNLGYRPTDNATVIREGDVGNPALVVPKKEKIFWGSRGYLQEGMATLKPMEIQSDKSISCPNLGAIGYDKKPIIEKPLQSSRKNAAMILNDANPTVMILNYTNPTAMILNDTNPTVMILNDTNHTLQKQF